MLSGSATCRRVSPLWPFWPPGFLPDGSRELRTRGCFFSPSLDGGLPLLLLSRPSRRSNSVLRAFSVAFSTSNTANRACSVGVLRLQRHKPLLDPFAQPLKVGGGFHPAHRQIKSSARPASTSLHHLTSLDRTPDRTRHPRPLGRRTGSRWYPAARAERRSVRDRSRSRAAPGDGAKPARPAGRHWAAAGRAGRTPRARSRRTLRPC